MSTHATRSLRRAIGAVLAALLLIGSAGAATAQQVYWSAPESIDAGQRSAIDLVFVDGEPTGPVSLPEIEGLRLLGAPSQSTSLAILNGQRSASTTFSYPVRAERSGTVHLPGLRVPTSAGTATVDAIDIEVQQAALRDADGSSTPIEDAVQARLTPSTMTPWAGQVFDLDFTLALTGNRRGEVVGTPTWSANAPSAEPWSDGQAVRTGSGSGVRFRTRVAAPTHAGRTTIAPATQDMRVESGRPQEPFGGRDPFAALRGRFGGADLFDSFFSRPQMAEVSAQSNAVQLDVRPLPAGAPADFSGAVGEFTLETTLSPEAPKTGEPVTWTLTLKGTGNWPSVVLPARAVPAELRTLQPKQRREFADGARFAGTLSEDLVLVPNQPGELNLAPVRFTYFSPISGRYETAEARPPHIAVSGAPLPQPASAPAP
ncbi:MAG: BatD family protein, partial [Deltaproteobacteria bacterium]|nr:BatD family protein [Deltaproteobacteria bacterium]